MKDELRSFACAVISSHIVCECAFLSAACSLPSGPARVQSSQNRHCWSLYAAERPPKLQNVGFSTLTFLMISHLQTKPFKSDIILQQRSWEPSHAAENRRHFLLTAACSDLKTVPWTCCHAIREHAPHSQTPASQRWKFHIEIPRRWETLTTATLFHIKLIHAHSRLRQRWNGGTAVD